jgi:FkbM family methyltransferase
MQSARDIMAGLFLNHSARFSKFRRLPLLGDLLHSVSHWTLPAGTLVWRRIRGGEGQGLWIQINPRTGRDYYDGTIEPAVQRFLAHHLRPGAVFYDIGANIGFFTLLAAQRVGDEGRVFSFEPEAELVSRIREHAGRNGLSNVSVVEAAVWSASGTGVFERCNPRSSPERGLGKVVSSQVREDTVSVRLVALDDFLETAPAPRVIKCDAEGGEVEIFRGARKLLALHRPVVICEIHAPGNLEVLREQFRTLRYRVSQPDDNHLAAEGD